VPKAQLLHLSNDEVTLSRNKLPWMHILALRPLYLEEGVSSIHRTSAWMGPRAGIDTEEKKKFTASAAGIFIIQTLQLGKVR
jgi:hypothetical protein